MSIIDDAKSKLRLVDYLVGVLGKPIKIGTTLRWNACPSCGRSKGESRKLRLNGKGDAFFCAKCGAKGDVVQAVQICEEKLTAIEAARWILYSGNNGTKISSIELPEEVEENEAMTACLSRLFDVSEKVSNQSAIDYLLKQRALSPKIILRASAAGILRFLPSNPSEAIKLIVDECGEDVLRESGLWRQGAKAPGIAFRPLVFFFQDKKGAEFRLSRSVKEGEVKAIRYGVTNMPWMMTGANEDIWSITEGAIDMMSIPCLTSTYEGSVMGVPGCNNWTPEWFLKLAGKKVYICFDNDMDDPDNPGQTWAKKVSDELKKVNAQPVIWLPKNAKDVNALLVAKRNK